MGRPQEKQAGNLCRFWPNGRAAPFATLVGSFRHLTQVFRLFRLHLLTKIEHAEVGWHQLPGLREVGKSSENSCSEAQAIGKIAFPRNHAESHPYLRWKETG